MSKTTDNSNTPGDLRVWNVINPPSDPETHPVEDVDHAMRLIDAMADSQLLISRIVCNVFGLEVYEGGEWEEWENEEGDQIDDLRRERCDDHDKAHATTAPTGRQVSK
jgi:hypothetical protein